VIQGYLASVKVLIVGTGVIGTIYGWALAEAGVEVTHVVRSSGRPSAGAVCLDLLDHRHGHPRHQQVRYTPAVVDAVTPGDGYELVVVATKHYQAAAAVRDYREGAPDATFLMFTANWDGPAAIDELLPRSRYLWGYAAASGGRTPDAIVANLRPDVRLGALEGSDPGALESVVSLFGRAGLAADLKGDIIEWLWVHHAINAGTIGTALCAGGLTAATRSPSLLMRGVRATREALTVVAARGVDITRYPDTRPFTKMPACVTAALYAYTVRATGVGRRLTRAGHFADNPHEMKQYYFDVFETGKELSVPMPYLTAMREAIEAYPE